MSSDGRLRRCVTVIHVAFEDLGTWEAEIGSAGYSVEYLQAGTDSLDAAADADLTVVLGGPIGVYEKEAYPFLKDELKVLQRRIANNLPVVGICLGAQLIAAAAGARVYSGDRGKELGWMPVSLTDAGRYAATASLAEENGVVLHWHGDTFDLPRGATLLASTERYPHQAFSLGDTVLAFQFHPEIDPATFERWLIGHTVEITATRGVSVPQLRADAKRYGPGLVDRGRTLIRSWLASL